MSNNEEVRPTLYDDVRELLQAPPSRPPDEAVGSVSRKEVKYD